MPQPAERRTFGIVIIEIPMTGLGRQQSSKDGWNRARTESKNGAKWLAVRQQIVQEFLRFNQLPTESINEHENVKTRGCLWIRDSFDGCGSISFGNQFLAHEDSLDRARCVHLWRS